MKFVKWILGIFGFLMIAVCISIFTSKRYLINSYDINNKSVFGNSEYYYHSGSFEKSDIKEIDKYFRKAKSLVDSLLQNNKDSNLKIILPYEDGISRTFPTLDLMIFHHTKTQNSPIIHEYIHENLGSYKEQWFTEGFATYITLYIKKKFPEMRSQRDIGDTWFKVKDYNTISRTNLTKAYNYNPSNNSFELLNFENKYIKRTQEERRLFYMASASFVEFLVNKYGLQRIIEISTKSNGMFKKSVIKEFNKRNINLSHEAENWSKQ